MSTDVGGPVGTGGGGGGVGSGSGLAGVGGGGGGGAGDSSALVLTGRAALTVTSFSNEMNDGRSNRRREVPGATFRRMTVPSESVVASRSIAPVALTVAFCTGLPARSVTATV